MSSAQLNWGILSTGAIARCFANAIANGDAGKVVAVGSRSAASANAFADEFDIPHRHASYEALLADGDVQAVYLAPPHPFHAEWAIKACEAGKHVLCEKPLTLNVHQAHAIVQAARQAGVFFMEAFMYRCHPQTAKLVELLKQGVIGQVRMVRSTFGFGGGDKINPAGRTFANELAGGGIMDVGCYPVSMARLIAGAVDGKPFANPTKVKALGQVGETRVDEWAAAVLQFDNGIIAQVATSVRASLENTTHIVGAHGTITLPDPWQASRGDATAGKIIVRAKGDEQVFEPATDYNSFSFEAAHMARAIAGGAAEATSPAMTWADSLGNMETLDKWRAEVGVVFDAETQAAPAVTVANRPLARRDDHNMTYGKVEGVDKPISKMVFGCDNQVTWAHASTVFDDWFERGGNAFDTSVIYGGGTQEKLLGQWIKSRGVADDVVVLAKGGHTPRCVPELIREDIARTLDRLQFDAVDLYVLHRDNTDIPVGELIDVLNDLISEGLIRGAIGGSNWTLRRMSEGIEYAKANGKQAMTVTSNNLSLAEMVKPVWAGCEHVSDNDSRQWYVDNKVANLSWSSQARGYFLEESLRMRLGQSSFESFDSADNQRRRARAEELAAKKGVSPINIAAAWVLCQPFASFALIGPRNVQETASTMPGLDVQLTQEEVDWLWNG